MESFRSIRFNTTMLDVSSHYSSSNFFSKFVKYPQFAYPQPWVIENREMSQDRSCQHTLFQTAKFCTIQPTPPCPYSLPSFRFLCYKIEEAFFPSSSNLFLETEIQKILIQIQLSESQYSKLKVITPVISILT